MSEHWRPFVSDAVLDLLGRRGAPAVSEPVRHNAVVLFADIAGFTRLSETLCATGKQGAEQLNRLLNGYFGQLVEQVLRHGGSVVRFAGDAVTAVFPCGGAERATARRAVQCALDVRAATARFRAAGSGEVVVKTGLALGEVTGLVLGDPGIRLEYLVLGPAVDRAAAVEHLAAPGEVVLDDSLLAAGPGLRSAPRGGGAHLVLGLEPPVPRGDLPTRPGPPAELLAPFLHRPVALRLRAGRRALLGEHRQVSVAFLGCPEQDPVALRRTAAAAVRVIDRYGGHLLQIDSGDKGTLLLAAFGAPVTHENHAERAVRCCLDLLALPNGPSRAGLTTGFAYCGEVGSEQRREYLIVGDPVNLAARLMQHARPGQLLIDAASHRLTARLTRSQELGPLRVKGKSAPVPVWAVHGQVAPQPRPSGPAALIGRDRELARLRAHLGRARAGRGRLVALTGEAGLGKSRLAAEAARIAAAEGFAVCWGAAQSCERTTSYLLWRPIWQHLLDLDPAAALPARQARLREYAAVLDGGSAQRAPLLAPVLNVPMPDTDLTAGLAASTRTESLHALLAEALRRHLAAGPLLLVLEDCHWADPASAALLRQLARGLAGLPVLLLATTRTGLAQARQLPLRELPPVQARELLTQRLRRRFGEAADPDGELVHALAARGEGNPFYLEELVNFLHARGDGLPTAVGAELPGSLQSLLTARLDQLGEAEQATVKVASVIGRSFRASWVAGAYPALGGADTVRERLDRLDRSRFTTAVAADPEPEHAFRHALTQQAVYDTLPFALRAQLHEAVGAHIERACAAELAEHVETLAHHYGLGENTAKQRRWFRAAAEAARATFANDTAIGHYQRLLPLLPPEQQAQVWQELGALWHLTGEWGQAEAAFGEAIELAAPAGDREVVAGSQRDLGLLRTYRRDYAEAIDWLRRAGAEFERLGDTRGLAGTLDRLAFSHFQLGDYPEAIAQAQRHLELATAIGDQAGRGAALENLGLIHGHTSNYAEAISLLEQAMRIARDTGNPRGLSYAANDLAGVHLRRGDHASAMACLEQARQAAERIGFRSLTAVLTGNAGELYREHGDHARALGCFSHALAIALDLGDWTSLLGQLGNLGLTAAAQGRPDLAERLLARSVRLARALSAPYLLCEFLYWLAKLQADQGRLAEANRHNAEALEIAEQIDHRHHRLHCRLLAIRLTGAAGQLDPLAAQWPEPADQAAVHAARWRLTGDPAARSRAIELYRELYTLAPSAESREQLSCLSPGPLPVTPPLPPLPAEVTRTDLDLDAVLARVDLGLLDRLADSGHRPDHRPSGALAETPPAPASARPDHPVFGA